MKDYIGYYTADDKILIGYYCYLDKYSIIYSHIGILYALTLDEKYLMKMFNSSIRHAVYSDMKTMDLEADYVGFSHSIEKYSKTKGLKPQQKYTKEDISSYILKLMLIGTKGQIFSYETFKAYILDLIRTNVYQELIDEKEYELNRLWQGGLRYPAIEQEATIEQKDGKYRYVGAKAGKYYTTQADTAKEELIRFLKVL